MFFKIGVLKNSIKLTGKFLWWSLFLNLFRMGEGPKRPPYQFFSCNFYKVGISLQNVLTFSFNPFGTLV